MNEQAQAERRRVAALRYFTPSKRTQDQLLEVARAAALAFSSSDAAVGFIDEEREVFSARVGSKLPENVVRERSFCRFVVETGKTMVVNDLRGDPRFAASPFVVSDGFRFYAAAPVQTREGYILGALCVLDGSPRVDSPVRAEILETLSRQVMRLLEDDRRLELLTDIQRSMAEKFATRPEGQLETAFDQLPVAALTLSGDGRVQRWNAAASALFGVSEERAIGKIPPCPVPATDGWFTESFLRHECLLVHLEGWRWTAGDRTLLIFTPVGYPSGPSAATIAGEDRLFANAASRLLDVSRSTRELLNRIVELFAPDFARCAQVISAKPGGRFVTEVSSWGEQPRPTLALNEGDLDALAPTVGAEGRSIARPSGVTLLLPLAPGRRMILALGFYPGELNARARLLATGLARLASKSLEHAFISEGRAVKIREQEEAMEVVTHDLKSPLNAMILTATSLSRSLTKQTADPRLILRVDRLLNLARRMSRLVVDLLDSSRIDRDGFLLRPSLTPLQPLIVEAVEMFKLASEEKQVTLAAELAPPDSPPVWCDRDRLLQVLANLIGNAIKFTPQDGSVTLRVSSEREGVTFRIEDTGPGIAPEHLGNLFDRFVQIRRMHRSDVGLGLAIAKGIVDAHGGRIWVESGVGSGSQFCFFLPAPSA